MAHNNNFDWQQLSSAVISCITKLLFYPKLVLVSTCNRNKFTLCYTAVNICYKFVWQQLLWTTLNNNCCQPLLSTPVIKSVVKKKMLSKTLKENYKIILLNPVAKNFPPTFVKLFKPKVFLHFSSKTIIKTCVHLLSATFVKTCINFSSL
jgi:hypothetical protein